ncbi:hypothetical protein Tco_0121356 [Tanacetum coccineum]
MDELIVYVSEKTYAYGAIRAENQDLLSTISELKTRLEKVEKGKSVNTKFDKTNGFQSLLCVTPLNKHAFQKKTDVSKTEENHVVSKPVTLQTSSNKQTGANQNKNVIKPGMYRVVTTQESQINKTKSGLSSTGVNATSRVRRPMSKDSSVTNSVLVNSKKAAKNVSVYVRKNKQKDNTSANVISNKEEFSDGDLEVAFHSNTCYVRNLEGDDLLTGGRDSNLYTISISDMAASLDLLQRSIQSINMERISFVMLVKRGKSKDKLLILLNWVPGGFIQMEKLLSLDLCGPNEGSFVQWNRVYSCGSVGFLSFARKMKTPEIIKEIITQLQLELQSQKFVKPCTVNGGHFIRVKFDELTTMASEHDCLEPELQRFNNYNSSAEPMNNPSKEDLDNLFSPMFEEYYEHKSSDTPIYSDA